MKKENSSFLSIASSKVKDFLNATADLFDSKDPLVIECYRGYANNDKLYLKGRVLENENFFEGKSENELRNVIDSLRKFDSDEIPYAKVSIEVLEQKFEVTADDEGFFELDTTWEPSKRVDEIQWIPATLNLAESIPGYEPIDAQVGEVMFVGNKVSFGVITDVDDTVLQTHVTSMFKLKMLYATLAKDAHQRLPMEGVAEVFQKLSRGKNEMDENPIFYVSNGPWNLHSTIKEFMEIHDLPKGPIALRDFGLMRTEAFSNHKIETQSRIMEMYPNLPFILLGDTAAKDTDFYIEIARKYPNRILAVYIRHTRDTKNARLIAKTIEESTDVNVVLIHSSEDILAHAKKSGYIA